MQTHTELDSATENIFRNILNDIESDIDNCAYMRTIDAQSLAVYSFTKVYDTCKVALSYRGIPRGTYTQNNFVAEIHPMGSSAGEVLSLEMNRLDGNDILVKQIRRMLDYCNLRERPKDFCQFNKLIESCGLQFLVNN